jgi:transposase
LQRFLGVASGTAGMELFVTDAQWARIAPLLPKRKRNPKGGRPSADDRACLEGILWELRTGARWRDLPRTYPSPATCWRRFADWEAREVWLGLWRAFLGELDARGPIGWEECFLDGTFAPAKEGGLAVGKTRKGEGTELMVLVERSGLPLGVCLEAATLARSASPSGPSPKSPPPARARVARA